MHACMYVFIYMYIHMDVCVNVCMQVLVWVLQATASKPLLIHCTKGTHRTGCIVGCLRKLEVFFFWFRV